MKITLRHSICSPRYSRLQKRLGTLRAIANSAAPRDVVYFVTFPLVGLESLESALVFSGRELPKVMAQHCAIIVDQPSLGRCIVYDFLPQSPTSPATAATLLRGGSVTGIVRSRAMKRVPPRRCTRIGTAVVPNAVQAAEDFNSSWDKKLKLFQNDCRNHSKQLARCLLDDQDWQIDQSLMPPLTNPLQS